LRECPKCSGDLYADPSGSGDTLKCLQCGLEVRLEFLLMRKRQEAEKTEHGIQDTGME